MNKSDIFEHLVLWPYRSLSRLGFILLMSFLALVLSVIGLSFFLVGAWPVVGFLGLEFLIVFLAFKLNYKAAKHHESIKTTGENLFLEQFTPDGKKTYTKFPIGWIRVQLSPVQNSHSSNNNEKKILLSSHGQHAEVGAFLHPSERPEIFNEIENMVDRSRNKPEKSTD